MKISAIQPNYFNRILFKAEENKLQTETQPNENEGMSKNTKITAGVVSAAVVLAGLGYMGYKGKLGKSIQKMLGGAEDVAANLEKPKRNPSTNPEIKINETEVPGSKIKPVAHTEQVLPTAKTEETITQAASDSIPPSAKVEEIVPEKVSSAGVSETVAKTETIITPAKTDDIIDVIAEEVNNVDIANYKFLTLDKFKTMQDADVLKKAATDLDMIETNSANYKEFSDNATKYFEKLRFFNPENTTKKETDIMDMFMERVNVKYADDLKVDGEYYEFKLAFAQSKIVKGDLNSAEEFVMEVITDGPSDYNKLMAFKELYKIESLQKLPVNSINSLEPAALKASLQEIVDSQSIQTKAINLFDRAVAKDLEEFNILQNSMNNVLEKLSKEMGENSSLTKEQEKMLEDAMLPMKKWEYFKNLVKELEPIYGKDNSTIVAVKSLNNEIEKFVEMITKRAKDVEG